MEESVDEWSRAYTEDQRSQATLGLVSHPSSFEPVQSSMERLNGKKYLGLVK